MQDSLGLGENNASVVNRGMAVVFEGGSLAFNMGFNLSQ